MEAPSRIIQLIEHFDRNYDHYKSSNYNETQLRREFLDPFFIALGWDVNNESGTFDAYKDVIHEDAIKIGGFTKAPDYCFRVGGARKFFVEAKKPAVNIKEDTSPAYQLRRYAWSAKLPLSILSDFEELAIYDCRIKPNAGDKAAIARTLFYSYKDYLTQWDKIASIFSKEAVWKGELDKYADVNKLKKGTTEVDDAFLDEIENWRDILARNLAIRNESLTQRQLNEIVQKTIDRIVFLRICEDRNIEKYGRLINLVNGANIYPRLCQLFQEADSKYNSGLFHFSNEKEQNSPPDELSLNLNIDDKVLKEIIKKLYYPDSPYEFSVLPADILGQVYEQFLGKVIRLTAGHQAKVEEKPEVKKAGGVYYTPTYIVDYIVNNTVGKLLEGKTPKEASELKILDPACGSGSFLIVAYQKLLDWHLKWYLDKIVPKIKSGSSPSSKAIQDLIPQLPETITSKKRKGNEPHLPIIELGPNDWRLTMAERKRILLNNIFGVDIDSQAVEVTKLSLLLKVLENENEQTLTPQLKLFQDRALPDLGNNIKCGNSLIGSEFYTTQMLPVESEEKRRINAFDWSLEFNRIMSNGGFDIIIGNPPYGNLSHEIETPFFNKCFEKIYPTSDFYAYFTFKSISLLKPNGNLGLIIPSAWLGGPQYKSFRLLCLSKYLPKLISLPFDIFKDAYIDTMLFFLTNSDCENGNYTLTVNFGKKLKLNSDMISTAQNSKVDQLLWINGEDAKIVLDPKTLSLIQNIKLRIENNFSDFIEMKRGVLFSTSTQAFENQKDDTFPYFEGHVYRYKLEYISNKFIEFGQQLKECPKEFKWFEGNRILLRRLVNRQRRLMAVRTDITFISNKNLYSIRLMDNSISLSYILGILNSKLISHLYLSQVSQATKDDFPQVTIKDILSLPIPRPGKEIHNKLAIFAEEMHQNCQLSKIRTSQEENIAQKRQIEATDRMIDQLVYELYGLTEEEIQIVEETCGK